MKHALKSLDIYTIGRKQQQQQQHQTQANATFNKEEKDMIENLGQIFSMLHQLTLKDIFSQTIDFLVEQTFKNSSITILSSFFLATPATSCTFATILIEYLISKMDLMGSSLERSNLYLKLFKLVFGSVSLFTFENEKMLIPHLHTLVTKSLDLAVRAKEPYNFFLLLRALFRSIGGGNHDLLYKEFLPILPILLQSLNELQTGLHKQYMKDLFVELCLTVPVRLSSLLPYLPLLMDPLVSALNGSPSIVSQGLRTLELCVDNLQPDFLYEHIQPVRTDLIQGLWRTLRSQNESNAQTAFRILGKLGGNNRKLMIEPQKLKYNTNGLNCREFNGPTFKVTFPNYSSNVELSLEKVIEACVNVLKSQNVDVYYKKHSFAIVQLFITSLISVDDKRDDIFKLFTSFNQFKNDQFTNQLKSYRFDDEFLRQMIELALACLFYATSTKDIRKQVLGFLDTLVTHFTLVSLAPYHQQDQNLTIQPVNLFTSSNNHLDFYLLIDAMFNVLTNDDMEYWNVIQREIIIMIEITEIILGNQDFNVAMIDYLAEKLCQLFYERSWYAKKAGCFVVKLFCKKMSLRWLITNKFLFLKSLMFMLTSAVGEISSGGVESANEHLDILIEKCAKKAPDELQELQQKALTDVIRELIKQITSPNTHVRKSSMRLLKKIAELQEKNTYSLIQTHLELLCETVGPRKNLRFKHYSENCQIGILEGLEFASSTQPQLFSLNLTNAEHQALYSEIIPICEGDETQMKNQTYINLRKASLNTLASFYHLIDKREQIFATLHNALTSTNTEIQETSFECLKKYQVNSENYLKTTQTKTQIENVKSILTIAGDHLREYLGKIQDYKSLNLNVMQHLTYITRLYPTILNEKFSEYLLKHLKMWLDATLLQASQKQSIVNEIKICSAIVSLFAELQSTPAKFLESLIPLILKSERAFMLEINENAFRKPLAQFLRRYPNDTFQFLIKQERLKDLYLFKFLIYLFKKEVKFLNMFKNEPQKCLQLIQSDEYELKFLGILIVNKILKTKPDWIAEQHELVDYLMTKIWSDEVKFHERHSNVIQVDFVYSKEPLFLINIFLKYHEFNKNRINLLFRFLLIFESKLTTYHDLIKQYFINSIAKTYSVEWKRTAFFEFVRIFNEQSDEFQYSHNLKANILQFIIIPCVLDCFENGYIKELIGGEPNPNQDDDNNLISVFINKIIDPENPCLTCDALRIFLLQLSSIFVQYAHEYIHDVHKKIHEKQLKRLMTFAWPCLLSKNCVDPINKYHGHLVLSHIIAKYAIHKRIVLQVFHSLLKAYAPEARIVVRQALDILTPSFPSKMDDGYQTLATWTKKIIIEESHLVSQLAHMLYIIVKYHKVYYLIRHSLITHMISSFQRVGVLTNTAAEHKQLAIDLTEVILRWEAQRVKDKHEPTDENENLLARHPDMLKPFEKNVADSVLNFFVKMSCPIVEPSHAATSNDQLSKRCLNLFKIAILNEIWPNADVKFEILDRVFSTLDNPTTNTTANITSVCTALDIILFLIDLFKPNKVQALFRTLQRGITYCLTCNNSRVIRSLSKIIQKLVGKFPLECFNNSIMSTQGINDSQTQMMDFDDAFGETPLNTEQESLNATISQFDIINSLFGQPDGVLSRVILEGFAIYEKSSHLTSGTSPQTTDTSTQAQHSMQHNAETLSNCLLLLKSASFNNPQYIDRMMGSFMKLLQKLYREHLANQSQQQQQAQPAQQNEIHNQWSDLLIQCLELVKNRVGVMSAEMRKMFINSILIALIDKSVDLRLIRFIVNMVSEWIKYKQGPLLNQIPSMKERLTLLQRLAQTIDKRYNDNAELQQTFLQTIAFVYKDDAYNTNTDFKTKLENAFLSGLKSTNPQIRQTFFDICNTSLATTDLYERLCFIIVSQNWEPFGVHYWIKQCIQLTLGSCTRSDTKIILSDPFLNLKFLNVENASKLFKYELNTESQAAQSVIEGDPQLMVNFVSKLLSDDESCEFDGMINFDCSFDQIEEKKYLKLLLNDTLPSRDELVNYLVDVQFKLYEFYKSLKIGQLIYSLCQLCHIINDLAHQIWIQLFIQMFNSLSAKQQQTLHGELAPFVASGSHMVQKQCQYSALNSFLESFALGKPVASFLKPSLLAYIAKNHNLWHRIILLLEHSLYTDVYSGQDSTSASSNELIQQPTSLKYIQHETFAALCNLFQILKEDDYRAGLWTTRSIHDSTKLALCFEQQGCFIQAQKLYEENISNSIMGLMNEPSNADELLEYNLWEEKWIKTCKELNQWDELNEYTKSKETDVCFVLDCAWKQPDWNIMKTLLTQTNNLNVPKELHWKIALFQGYYLVFHPDDFNIFGGPNIPNYTLSAVIDNKVEKCINLAIKEWKRLPRLTGPAHVQLLQAAQQIIELQESFQIQNGLQSLAAQSVTSTTNIQSSNPQSILQEIKSCIKTWRTRLPLVSDDISYWNDIFTWRQFHYEAFTKYYEKQSSTVSGNLTNQTGANNAMHGVHALANGIVYFGKVARKHHLYELCLTTLNKIHLKQSVPIIDCFHKVKQEIKCYINTFEFLNPQQAAEIMDLIEATNLKYFTKDNVAELLSLKGQFLQTYGKFEEANHLFSYSVALNDNQPKLWGSWGDYLAEAFVGICSRGSDAYTKRNMEAAESALIALLHAARHNPQSSGEVKVRKYIAKILWLLSYDNDKKVLHSTFDSNSVNILSSNWINWIPQLVTSITREDGRYFVNLMNQIARHYPLALYYPLRTNYIKLKTDEQAEKIRLLNQQQQTADAQAQQQKSNGISEISLRMSTLIHRQRELHPMLNTLESLIDALVNIKVHWYEELLKNFKQTLNQCYQIAFENKDRLHAFHFDPFSINTFKKLYKFYTDLSIEKLNQLRQTASKQPDNQNNSVKRILSIVSDPDYLLTKTQFLHDFNFTQPTSISLFLFVKKLRQWIKMFEAKIHLLPNNQQLDERFKLLSQFSLSIADIEIPGEHLVSYNITHTNTHSTHNTSHYYVKISRFLPRIESVEKYNYYAKRIYIRGHNGKVYPYLITNEIVFNDCRKEQHQLQLLRMLNIYLCKQKETAKHNLHFSIPRIVTLSSEVRMIEDNNSAISILDIYKNRMRKFSIIKAFQTAKSSSHKEILPQIFHPSDAAELPIVRYYERLISNLTTLSSTQTTSHSKQFLLENYKHILNTFVPKVVIKEWALYTYSDANDYFEFRKLFTHQLALYGLIEYVFHLTRINPDQFYVSQDSGLCQALKLRFDINEQNGEFNQDRQVYSRLTPNIVEFITTSGLNGILSMVKIATARCLIQPNYHLTWILRAIIKDEIVILINNKKRNDLAQETENEIIINSVNKLVNQMENRLKSKFSNCES